MKGLLGVPIPGPFALAVGQYVAEQGGVTFLPDDKTRCKKIVKLVVPFRFGPRGGLSLGAVGGQRTYFISDYGDFTAKKDLRVAVQQG